MRNATMAMLAVLAAGGATLAVLSDASGNLSTVTLANLARRSRHREQ